ncbi:DNA 3'-5' helicase OS=Streptomyces tendae OX=1932 GN=GUR47_14935 PE=3 SV=1 [Streptomyces tendae]
MADADADADPDAEPARGEGAHGADDPCRLPTETALALRTSPLAGMDAADLRRLGRALRDEQRAAGNPLPPPSDELLARALAEPERLPRMTPRTRRAPSGPARWPCARQ